ncbi:MAG: HlyD family efflux transporter periplasmic adaptor subunit [Parvibaculum sp.]|nr:HlyD family efflux transporter periplasmic adaptor subunit [Parvibaculum sp.]
MRLHTLLFAGVAAFLPGGCDNADGLTYQGYAEGEYVRVAALEGGIIVAIPVQRGDRVGDGALLFQLDQTLQIAAREQALARQAQARAQRDDVNKGLRPTEITALKSARASAAAALTKANGDLSRAKELFAKGHVSKAALDSATASHDAAAAALHEANARLATGGLPARADQIAAAEANLKATDAALAEADWHLAQREGYAPSGGLVEDVYFRVGEAASPGQAVVSILPPANIKIRFFITEPELGRVHIGNKVQLACDACAENLTGTVRFISTQAEYTPPVIYSENAKSKLVYMAEAIPDITPEAFHPGQPLRVTLTTTEQ